MIEILIECKLRTTDFPFIPICVRALGKRNLRLNADQCKPIEHLIWLSTDVTYTRMNHSKDTIISIGFSNHKKCISDMNSNSEN